MINPATDELFTPQELLTVAQRVMPQTGEQAWMIWECPVSGEFVATSERYLKVDFNPEVNHDQWRALAEFVANAGITLTLYKNLYQAVVLPDVISHESHAGCMIAAVLALEVSEK